MVIHVHTISVYSTTEPSSTHAPPDITPHRCEKTELMLQAMDLIALPRRLRNINAALRNTNESLRNIHCSLGVELSHRSKNVARAESRVLVPHRLKYVYVYIKRMSNSKS